MNKKITASLLVTMLLSIVCVDKVTFASNDFAKGLQLNITAKSILTLNRLYEAIYTMGLDISKEFKNNNKITVSLKGCGINNNYPKDLYAEIIWQKSFFDNKLNVNFGKFGFSKYFDKNSYTGDASTQFLTDFFIFNKTIESLGDRVGLRLNYTFEKFDIDYGYFRLLDNKFAKNGFNVLQINYKPSKKENYRIYVWKDDRKYYVCEEKEDELRCRSGISGLGVSLDREINKQIGTFAKVGYKNPFIGTIVKKEGTGDISSLSLLWNTGIQVKSSLWSRKDDVIGLAVGQTYRSSDYKEQNKFSKNYRQKTQTELYYKFTINNNFTITPVLQYTIPSENNTKNGPLIWGGIRTYFKF
ncbi:MAG: carbohydrate porin [Endomicrobium sp.]|jgi:hypothetical protein|nr:carbohydrate porin [Endomicrobium sp.]